MPIVPVVCVSHPLPCPASTFCCSTPAAAQAADYSANVFPFVTQAAVQRALFRVLDPCCMSVQVYVQGDEEKKGQAQAELAALVASTLAEAAAGERAASAGAGAGSSAGGSSEGDDSAPVDLVALATAHLHTLHPSGKQGVDTARLGASASSGCVELLLGRYVGR